MIPLVEKYRPQTIDDVVGQDHIKTVMRGWQKEDNFPAFLLYGRPGVGKTAIIKAFLREHYNSSVGHNAKEWNSSDDRGIQFIRDTVKKWATTAPKDGYRFRTLYLGEIDGLTPQAQDALKRTMELAAKNVRFVADCNDVDSLIPAMKSRFVRIYAHEVEPHRIASRLGQIAESEGFSLSNNIVEHIAEMCNGDMREALMYLSALPKKGATLDLIQSLAPIPTKKAIIDLIRCNFAEEFDFEEREKHIKGCMKSCAMNANAILHEMYELFLRKESSHKQQILVVIAEYIWRIQKGGNPEIWLRCCLDEIRGVIG